MTTQTPVARSHHRAYLSGISNDEVLEEARVRPVPTLSAPDMIEVLRARH